MKAKGWTPYYYDVIGGLAGWREYDGIDEEPNRIALPITETFDEKDPIHNLAGQRIENLQGKKGVYIVGGRKVLVK